MGHPRPLFSFVFVFANKHYKLFNKNMSSVRCLDSNTQPSDHQSHPITTRPGLPAHSICRYVVSFFSLSICTICSWLFQSLSFFNLFQTLPPFVYCRLFHNNYTTTNIAQNLTVNVKVQIVCLGFKHGSPGWQKQTNPQRLGGPLTVFLCNFFLSFTNDFSLSFCLRNFPFWFHRHFFSKNLDVSICSIPIFGIWIQTRGSSDEKCLRPLSYPILKKLFVFRFVVSFSLSKYLRSNSCQDSELENVCSVVVWQCYQMATQYIICSILGHLGKR